MKFGPLLVLFAIPLMAVASPYVGEIGFHAVYREGNDKKDIYPYSDARLKLDYKGISWRARLDTTIEAAEYGATLLTREAVVSTGSSSNKITAGFQSVKWLENFSKHLDDPFNPQDLRRYIGVRDNTLGNLGFVHDWIKESWSVESFFWVHSFQNRLPKEEGWFDVYGVHANELNGNSPGTNLLDRYGLGTKLRLSLWDPWEWNIYIARVMDPMPVFSATNLTDHLNDGGTYSDLKRYSHFNVMGMYGSYVAGDWVWRHDLMLTQARIMNYSEQTAAGLLIGQKKTNQYSGGLGLDYSLNPDVTLTASAFATGILNPGSSDYFVEKQNYLISFSLRDDQLPCGANGQIGYSRYLSSNGGYLFAVLSRTFYSSLQTGLELDYFHGNEKDVFSYASYKKQAWVHATYTF